MFYVKCCKPTIEDNNTYIRIQNYKEFVTKESIINYFFKSPDNEYFDKPFRIKQIFTFIFKQKIFDFQAMTNISTALRDALDNDYGVLDIEKVDVKESVDGTKKFLFKLSDDNCIESVVLKDKNERLTFCISTQSGCRMGCTFCLTGKMNLKRNLNFSEIVSQVLYLSALHPDKHFNIVFMGMGEPLDNYDNLAFAIKVFTDKLYMDMSVTRITVSTCGLVHKIPQLVNDFPSINLAVSINTLIQEKRERIMPISRKYPVDVLMKTLNECYVSTKNRITLEYVLLKGFNMGQEDIDAFSGLKRGRFLINIIPENQREHRPSEKSVTAFCNKLRAMGFNVSRRYRRGDDISAACGQLYWENRE